MKAIVYLIGVFVLTVILYAIPVLTICSFIYEWNSFLKMVLLMISIIEMLGLSGLIMIEVDREER